MITCKLMGGLGNQLFQIATTLAVAWDHNDDAVFDLSGHQYNAWQGQPANYYQETLYRDLIDRKIWFPRYFFSEKGHHYTPIAYHSQMQLSGYFQSEKYFVKYRDRLLNLFAPPADIQIQLEQTYRSDLHSSTCAIHVRRGDYLKLPKNHPVCSLDYYDRAIAKFDRSTSFVVFSDDLEWCRHQSIFTGDRFTFWKSNRDDLDLYLMSMFPHQIIANSSFSWWGSWLNRHPDKLVIAPSLWFGDRLKHLNTKDIYTDWMVKI